MNEFLNVPTPIAWLEYAASHLSDLLVDHALCEKKAASTALSLMYRYPEKPLLLHHLSRLAREELRHFEQVLAILTVRGIIYEPRLAGRYAGTLKRAMRTSEPHRLLDTLIVGAFIEARSCERFEALLPYLDETLSVFYRRLVQSELRHFEQYLMLAREYDNFQQATYLEERIHYFSAVEAELITSPDWAFRFHSGVPV